MFPCLISGICLEARVPLLPFEEVETPNALLNYKTIDNSEAMIRARENRVSRAPVVQPDEKAHDSTHLALQTALTTETNLSIQFTQIQVVLTEISILVNTMQATLLEVQHTQHNMQQELQRVSMQVRGLQYKDFSIRSEQHTITSE
ncbi:hypothetical protein Adt_31500 [Abeliophyllum distichum]|uniref:Uncharacterized protein n=1 Tax=Abeliophyllum distichum TaxID=126358 RepID=A0ABD1RHX1_9LAMI